jgi:transposase
MYEGFVNAAKEVFGKKTKVVIDRFHVAKQYRSSFDDLRKKELYRLKKELDADEYKKLKNIMWIVRKKACDLKDTELATLKLLFKHSPVLELAYSLRNEMTSIFDEHISKSKAKIKLNSWIRKVRKSGLTCFDKFISTLEEMMDEVLNYFIHRYNSGFVEGFNNKVKILKRRCYGIFNPNHLFQRIYLDLNGYQLFATTIYA